MNPVTKFKPQSSSSAIPNSITFCNVNKKEAAKAIEALGGQDLFISSTKYEDQCLKVVHRGDIQVHRFIRKLLKTATNRF